MLSKYPEMERHISERGGIVHSPDFEKLGLIRKKDIFKEKQLQGKSNLLLSTQIKNIGCETTLKGEHTCIEQPEQLVGQVVDYTQAMHEHTVHLSQTTTASKTEIWNTVNAAAKVANAGRAFTGMNDVTCIVYRLPF